MKKYLTLLFLIIIQFSANAQTDIKFDDINSSKDYLSFIELLSGKGYLLAEKDLLIKDNLDYMFNKTGNKNDVFEAYPVRVGHSKLSSIVLTYNESQVSSYESITNEIKLNCTKISGEYDERFKTFMFKYKNTKSSFEYSFYSWSNKYSGIRYVLMATNIP